MLRYVVLILIASAALATPLKSDMRAYDLESLGWAAMMSLFGGALRTVFTLATGSLAIGSVRQEMAKDAIVAVVAGVIAFIGMEAVRASSWVPVNSELRFAVIVFAGWSRLSFFGWINQLGIQVTESIAAKIRGNVPSPPPTTTLPPKTKPFKEK